MVKNRLSGAVKVSASLIDGEASRARKSCGLSNKGDRPTPLCEGLDAAYLRSQVREWDRDGGIIRPPKTSERRQAP